MDQAKAFGQLIAAARAWAQARAQVRRLSDSKKATKDDLKKARSRVVRTGNRLEKTIVQFNKAVRLPTTKKPFDWGHAAGVVAKIAGGLEQAVKGPDALPTPTQFVEVIDVDGKTVK